MLLYQKVGCFQDNVHQRDFSAHPTLVAITQEKCVKECAIQDEAFAYFALQNGSKCFCGRRYGKYGRVPEEMCNKHCLGNEEENCGGENSNMIYFYGIGIVEYLLSVVFLSQFIEGII